MPKELFTNDPDVAGDGLFMEWAVGKNGDEMRPDSGRLMLPGSKIAWDIHHHAVGEEISDTVELGIYFYPKGQISDFNFNFNWQGVQDRASKRAVAKSGDKR